MDMEDQLQFYPLEAGSLLLASAVASDVWSGAHVYSFCGMSLVTRSSFLTCTTTHALHGRVLYNSAI